MAIHDVECCEECAVHDEVVQSVRGMLPDDDDLYDLAELFKVFGDSTRIRILFVLKNYRNRAVFLSPRGGV